MTEVEIRGAVREFVVVEILEGEGEELGDDTPLLSLGILNSFEIQRLSAFLRERFGLAVAWEKVGPEDFRDIGSIARLVACAGER